MALDEPPPDPAKLDDSRSIPSHRAVSGDMGLEIACCRACGAQSNTGARFCSVCGCSLTNASVAPGITARPERRHLTVLFCDLAGSTLLASRLDPEDMRDVILCYQDACNGAIRRYDGTISRYVGDGILALFGFPHAHEDDPERAVRAALDIVSAVENLRIPVDGVDRIQVRVGIATGVVVVGDLVGEGAAQEQAVVGDTPNLAARLQGLALPNSVVIAPATRMLIGERFECVNAGSYKVHEHADAVRVYRVIASRSGASRFEARQTLRLAPIVDREEYTRWLRGLWKDVGPARGRAALLSGEAGIGKSRIVEALREKIAGTPYAALRFQCSPHYENTALHPVIDYLERAAGILREDTSATKLERLETWLGQDRESDAVGLLADLLAIPTIDSLALPPMSPQLKKERTFEVLLSSIHKLAAVWPVPIVFEDVHWVDPTTQEFLTLLLERVGRMRALIVVTFRPTYRPPDAWYKNAHVEQREILKLPPEHATNLAASVARDRLPQEVLDDLVAKTDGVPLFIEELTRAVIDTEPSNAPGHTYGSGRFQRAIPSTLRDSLMARLDQLGPAKVLAQIAAVIGREFSYELLEAVANLPPQALRADLEALENSGLVHAETSLDAAAYTFKHALVRDAAYESLLNSRKRELHRSIAKVLLEKFPQTVRDTPELLAHHWTQAGEVQHAVGQWLAAGRRASERSEYDEAIAHLQQGLDLVQNVDDEKMRLQSELDLLLALGPLLIGRKGGGTPEVADLYQRALFLCEGTPPSAAHFVAQWGWWRASMNHRSGRERADTLLNLARDLDESQLLVQAHHCEWATLYMLGAHSMCCSHVDQGLALYEARENRVYSALYGGHDAKVCGLGEASLAHWMLGKPEAATHYSQAALAWADELGHVVSRAHAMDYAIVFQKFCGNVPAVATRADELRDYAAQQKLHVHRGKAEFFTGWARAVSGGVDRGLNEMLTAIAVVKGNDTPTDFPLYYEMLAEILGRTGRYAEALETIGEAFAIAEAHGIVFWNAELHRRRGELLFAAGERDEAKASYMDAFRCARLHQARALELRAAMSLVRLQDVHDEHGAAESMLRACYECFDEGLETPDLVEAREMLGPC